MQAASNQRVSSNAGKDKEHVLAEFAYQPAAEGKRQNGEAKSASKAEVTQLVQNSRAPVPKHPDVTVQQALLHGSVSHS